MKTEKISEQNEMVRSLASTIHKKMVAPSSGRADLINKQIQQINQKMESFEKEISRLDSSVKKTRLLACSLAAAAALLSLVLFYIVLR